MAHHVESSKDSQGNRCHHDEEVQRIAVEIGPFFSLIHYKLRSELVGTVAQVRPQVKVGYVGICCETQ